MYRNFITNKKRGGALHITGTRFSLDRIKAKLRLERKAGEKTQSIRLENRLINNQTTGRRQRGGQDHTLGTDRG